MKTVTPNEHARLPVPLPETDDSNFARHPPRRKPSSEAGGLGERARALLPCNALPAVFPAFHRQRADAKGGFITLSTIDEGEQRGGSR
jgi:hypothetical protein